ncbi:MAG TPA: family 43 glycosylhydrolase [Prolixibacteraceae bacterium]|nr:family 43 glycosylhydrolase [Prolixibacteraceae bacterium]
MERDILPEETFMGKGTARCWATDISTRNGKYYFYFSNGGTETGVLVAGQPNGPYLDVLKKPLIPEDFSVNHEYDPTIFVDDDGKQYIIFGRDGFDGKNLIHYQIARLSEDMLSLAEPPRDLMTEAEFGFGAKNRARDHQYFHKYNGTYYLSCAGAYRTSNDIQGPYTNLRQTGQDGGHSSFCAYNGQWYHMYEWTCEPFGNRSYRQVSMTYLHYRDNGDMVDDPEFLQQTASSKEGRYFKTGVGNYDADWEKIEAEWFFKSSGALVKKECPAGGFEIQKIENGDFLNFPNIKNLQANCEINFSVSSTNSKGGVIEIHQDSETGPILGKCKVHHTDSASIYNTVSCKLNNNSGLTNLFLVFKGGKGELMHLNYFAFSNN